MQRVLALTLNADGSMMAGLLMGAGILIIAFVGFARFRALRGRDPLATMKNPVARAPKPAPKSGESAEHLRAVMTEMQELTRACAAQIESKVAKLEATIREADDRLARLNGMGGVEPHRIEPKPMPGVEVRRVTPSKPTIGGDELSQRVFALADAGRTPADIARELSEHTGRAARQPAAAANLVSRRWRARSQTHRA